jgi:hypothetical protein
VSQVGDARVEIFGAVAGLGLFYEHWFDVVLECS